MNPKLSSTISIVKISDDILEFFKTSIRQQLHIKVQDDTIINIVTGLDGTRSVEEIAEFYNVKYDDLNNLLMYLSKNGILDNVEDKSEFKNYEKYRRVIHFISEYSNSHNNLVNMWQNIRNATVIVIGLGAVGSWVACNLAQSGVKNIALMDSDIVDITNLHRQFGYRESDIGRKKIDVLEEIIHGFDKDINVIKEYSFLNEGALNVFDDISIDLIINCADNPTVDETSLWVGEYAMKRGLPHIVGGGYNLHLSLVGQTIIPGKSACMKCFQKALEEENKIDSKKVKKLAVKNRKVGSFGPMCSMIASMIGMESIKVLSKGIEPSNLNRRGEFDIYKMDIEYKNYERRNDCEWCGEHGEYYS